MTRMHNPPRSGEVLRQYLGNITVTEAALNQAKGVRPRYRRSVAQLLYFFGKRTLSAINAHSALMLAVFTTAPNKAPSACTTVFNSAGLRGTGSAAKSV